jgi:hypothetical protein
MMRMMQQAMFMKNLGLLGGALLIAYFGAGPVSLDERARRPVRKATRAKAVAAYRTPLTLTLPRAAGRGDERVAALFLPGSRRPEEAPKTQRAACRFSFDVLLPRRYLSRPVFR